MKIAISILLLFPTILLPMSGEILAEDPLLIGVSAPLTGESAVFGEDIKDVIVFANEFFGDKNIKLEIQDDQCSGKGGSSVAQYFIQKRARTVSGFACVESIMPAIPPLQKAGIPVVSVLASGPEITGIGRNVFNVYPSDNLGVKLIEQRLSELKITRVLVLTAQSAFPIGISEAFKKQVKNSPLQVSYTTYLPTATDFASILSKSESKKAQAIFINYSSASEFIALLKERKRLRISTALFTSYLNGYEAIKAQGYSESLEGVEFYDTAPMEISLQGKDRIIFDRYLKEKGHLKSSDGYFPFIFNGYVAVRTALFGAKGVSEELRTKTIENGIGAPFSFGPDGAVQGGIPFILRAIEDGVPVTRRQG